MLHNQTSIHTYYPTENPSIARPDLANDKDVATHRRLDPAEEAAKAARMADIFLNRTYASARTIQRMRLRMITHVIRHKVTVSLKRLFDICLVLLTLPAICLFAVPVIIAIKLDSPGPILFKQVRVGHRGKPFACYKFRSMYVDAEKRKQELMDQNEADEIVFKMRNDPRITPVGRLIRKLSIDEIPQFYNVLKGEMSLVGPRPAVPAEVKYYKFEYLQRLDAVPGITGLQQVSGRSDLDFKRWIELDLQYIQEQSVWKDIKILLKTIPAVVLGRGAY